MAERLAFGMACTCLFDERIEGAVEVAAHLCTFEREEQASRVQATHHAAHLFPFVFMLVLLPNSVSTFRPPKRFSPGTVIRKNFYSLALFPIIRFCFEQIPYFPLDKYILSS
jgi:hypothetical protein